MVMMHSGLHRVQHVDAMDYDIPLGPRGLLSAAAAAAATSFTVDNIESGISTIPSGTWILVGGVQEKQNREMVKTSAAIAVSATGTATITIATALVKPFAKGTRITISFLPVDFDSGYRKVPDLEPYIIPSEDSVVYQLYPCVPMQAKFIGRDGGITATGLANDEATFNQLTHPSAAFTDATCDTDHAATGTDTTVFGGNVKIVQMDSTTLVKVGMGVSGTGIAAHSVVTQIDSATLFRVSIATTATNTNQTLTFTPVTRFQHMGAALQGNHGAVGTVTFTGNPTTDQTIAIISTDGTTKTYTAKGANNFSSNQFKADAGAATNATNLKSAIEHASGHAGKILVSRATGVLTLTQNFHPIGNQGNTTITENLANCAVVNFTGGEYLGLHDSVAAVADYDEDSVEVGSASRDIAGWISAKIFINQPYGVMRHNFHEDTSTASTRSPLSSAAFIDAHVSPENSPNPAFEFWIGVGETSLPEFRIKNDSGEALHDPRLRLIGYKYLMTPVPVAHVAKMLKRAGRFKYEIIPRAEDALSKEQAHSAPMAGWGTHVRTHKGSWMTLAEYKEAISAPSQQLKNILQGTNTGGSNSKGLSGDPRRRHR